MERRSAGPLGGPPVTTGRLLIALAVALISFAGLGLVAPVAAQAPRPAVVTYVFKGVTRPAQSFDVTQQVVEYGAGARGAATVIDTPRYFTVIEGELTASSASIIERYSAGKSFTIARSASVQLSNEGGSAARVMISSLVPPGMSEASTTGPAPSATAPNVVASSRLPVFDAPASFDIVQMVQDYAPGAATAPHMMNHRHLICVLNGENTTKYLDGASERLGAGQQGVMAVGRAGTMENTGTTNSRVVLTWLQEPDKPLTTAAQAAAAQAPTAQAAPLPPRAGSGGFVGASKGTSDVGAAVLAVLAVLSGSVVVRRIVRR